MYKLLTFHKTDHPQLRLYLFQSVRPVLHVYSWAPYHHSCLLSGSYSRLSLWAVPPRRLFLPGVDLNGDTTTSADGFPGREVGDLVQLCGLSSHHIKCGRDHGEPTV